MAYRPWNNLCRTYIWRIFTPSLWISDRNHKDNSAQLNLRSKKTLASHAPLKTWREMNFRVQRNKEHRNVLIGRVHKSGILPTGYEEFCHVMRRGDKTYDVCVACNVWYGACIVLWSKTTHCTDRTHETDRHVCLETVEDDSHTVRVDWQFSP